MPPKKRTPPPEVVETLNAEDIQVGEAIEAFDRVGDAVCKLYARCFETAKGCYSRNFPHPDGQDRANILQMADAIFGASLGLVAEEMEAPPPWALGDNNGE